MDKGWSVQERAEGLLVLDDGTRWVPQRETVDCHRALERLGEELEASNGASQAGQAVTESVLERDYAETRYRVQRAITVLMTGHAGKPHEAMQEALAVLRGDT